MSQRNINQFLESLPEAIKWLLLPITILFTLGVFLHVLIGGNHDN
jgi:hypothetical protein